MTERPDDDVASDAVETAMGSGSDAGAPGDRLPDPPLDAEDLETLAIMLETEPNVVDGAVEDSPGVQSAVEDDSPIPGPPAGGQSGHNDDGLDARFLAPGQD